MTTLTVDIIDEKALPLLKDLEALNIIKVRGNSHKTDEERIASIQSLKGKMTKQPLEEIEKQLAEFRAE